MYIDNRHLKITIPHNKHKMSKNKIKVLFLISRVTFPFPLSFVTAPQHASTPTGKTASKNFRPEKF